MKLFVVTYTDFGESADSHSRLLGSFPTKEAAQAAMCEDMGRWPENCGRDDVEFRFDEVWVRGECGTYGCVWDIHEVEAVASLEGPPSSGGEGTEDSKI